MESAVKVLGLQGQSSLCEAQRCALVVRQLRLDEAASKASLANGDELLSRRCGLLGVPSSSFAVIEQNLPAVERGGDVGLLLMKGPELESFKNLLSAPGLMKHWLLPMKRFCSVHGPGSPDQRAQVRELLCRCGWADQPNALRFVLEELQWDTLPVLRFALELLRPRHNDLWVPLADILQARFGAAAVLPLRKLIDPKLTLALVIAAPDNLPVMCFF